MERGTRPSACASDFSNPGSTSTGPPDRAHRQHEAHVTPKPRARCGCSGQRRAWHRVPEQPTLDRPATPPSSLPSSKPRCQLLLATAILPPTTHVMRVALTLRISCGPPRRGACAFCKRRDGADRQLDAVVGQPPGSLHGSSARPAASRNAARLASSSPISGIKVSSISVSMASSVPSSGHDSMT